MAVLVVCDSFTARLQVTETYPVCCCVFCLVFSKQNCYSMLYLTEITKTLLQCSSSVSMFCRVAQTCLSPFVLEFCCGDAINEE